MRDFCEPQKSYHAFCGVQRIYGMQNDHSDFKVILTEKRVENDAMLTEMFTLIAGTLAYHNYCQLNKMADDFFMDSSFFVFC